MLEVAIMGHAFAAGERIQSSNSIFTPARVHLPAWRPQAGCDVADDGGNFDTMDGYRLCCVPRTFKYVSDAQASVEEVLANGFGHGANIECGAQDALHVRGDPGPFHRILQG